MPDIQNINGVYDTQFYNHYDLHAGAWHHTALVFTGASAVAVYTDGVKVYDVRLTGRSFNEDDLMQHLELGPASGGPELMLDEVLILNRPVTGDEIASYYQAMRQFQTAGYSD